jgi:hypothetical protein
VGIRCTHHATRSVRKKLALTSPTSGGRSAGIIRSQTKATEFSLVALKIDRRLGGIFRLHLQCLQGRKIRQKRNKHKSGSKLALLDIMRIFG